MKTIRMTGLVLAMLFIVNGCYKVEYEELTSFDQLIGDYLADNKDEFSSLYYVLQQTGYLSFLKTYGTYTLFAPTNEAFDRFLADKGKSSLDDFSREELMALVRYHVIADTLNTTTFTDGKLPTPTMYGQYLTALSDYDEGETRILVNKYAELKAVDIRLANGILHSLKSVLEPVTLSVSELLEKDPDFSIFSQALKETGLYDTLKQVSPADVPAYKRRWFTVLAHTNETYATEGINTYEDLKQRYSHTGNPGNPEDSLYLYMAYHILDNSLKYVADLIKESAHLTMAPLEVITIRLKGDSVLVNEDVFLDILEKGSPINRGISDNTAANGVFHVAEHNLFIKVRFPTALYWDVADQPEIRQIPGVFRVRGQYVNLSNDQLANITWNTNDLITYNVSADWMAEYYVYSDDLRIPFRNRLIAWMQFKTPVIVRGRYKVWICGRHVYDPDRRPRFFVKVNDHLMPNVVDMGETLPGGFTDTELELQGLKRYNYIPTDSTYLADINGRWVGRLVGTVEIEVTGHQTVEFISINDGDKGLWIDMIHFIPVEQNQLWPRVDIHGVLRDMPDWYENY